MTQQNAIEAARASLAEANQRHADAKRAVSDAAAAHQRAVDVHRGAAAALQSILEGDAARNASAAARLADIIRSGDAAAIDGARHDHNERLEAERRAAIAKGAVDALAADWTAAQTDQAAAQTAVEQAIKGVLLAHRDAIASELTAAAERYLDLRHTLGGLMSVHGIPGTSETDAALNAGQRDYPPLLHPQSFAAKAWSDLQKALREDPEAEYVPILPSVQPQAVHPAILKHREILAAQEAERAANAKRNAEQAKSANQQFVPAERFHDFANRAAGG
jgi:hypothetical protein